MFPLFLLFFVSLWYSTAIHSRSHAYHHHRSGSQYLGRALMSRSLNLDRDSVEEKEFERRTRGEKVVSFHQAATRVRYRWVATVPNMAPALHRIGDARIFPSSRPLLLLLLLPFDMIRLVLAAALHFFASIFFIIYSRVFQMTAHSYVVANLTPFSNERGNAEARSFLQLAMIGDKKITSHTHRQTDRDGVRSNCLYDPNLHTSRNARPASVVVPYRPDRFTSAALVIRHDPMYTFTGFARRVRMPMSSIPCVTDIFMRTKPRTSHIRAKYRNSCDGCASDLVSPIA